MEVRLQQVSKRFVYDWIIKDLSADFASNSTTGINGINGSGKSTLIKMISGWLSPSKGNISYRLSDKEVKRDDIYTYLSIVAPYTDIIVEYDLREMYQFHTQFKTLQGVEGYKHFEDIVKLKGQKGKPLQYYSSGMKQRVQLALAVLTDSRLLLLDEPTSFLDSANKQWFYELLQQRLADRTTIISSNDLEDFQYCERVLEL